MNNELSEALYKRAVGFCYDEEVKEFEQQKVRNGLLCEKRGRVYFKSGYVKVRISYLNSGEIGSVKRARTWFLGRKEKAEQMKMW